MATINKAEAMKATTPAEFARAIGVDPKRLRSKLRSSGIKVSENRGAFDAKAKQSLWDHFVEEAPKASAKPAKGKAKAATT